MLKSLISFNMDKALRNTIIVGILLIGGSVFYYLVVYIPQRDQMMLDQEIARDKEQKEDKLKSECIEEKKDSKEAFLKAINACTSDECRESTKERLSINNDTYIDNCLERKHKGLPTRGY